MRVSTAWSHLVTEAEPTSVPLPASLCCARRALRDEAAVKVEALAAALGHHDAGSQAPVGMSCQSKQQHVEAHKDGQAERVAAVVVPVGRGQRAEVGAGVAGELER